jgi:hypothetical protein
MFFCQLSINAILSQPKRGALTDIDVFSQSETQHERFQWASKGDDSFESSEFHGVFLPGGIALPVVPVEFGGGYSNVLRKSQEVGEIG